MSNHQFWFQSSVLCFYVRDICGEIHKACLIYKASECFLASPDTQKVIHWCDFVKIQSSTSVMQASTLGEVGSEMCDGFTNNFHSQWGLRHTTTQKCHQSIIWPWHTQNVLLSIFLTLVADQTHANNSKRRSHKCSSLVDSAKCSGQFCSTALCSFLCSFHLYFVHNSIHNKWLIKSVIEYDFGDRFEVW